MPEIQQQNRKQTKNKDAGGEEEPDIIGENIGLIRKFLKTQTATGFDPKKDFIYSDRGTGTSVQMILSSITEKGDLSTAENISVVISSTEGPEAHEVTFEIAGNTITSFGERNGRRIFDYPSCQTEIPSSIDATNRDPQTIESRLNEVVSEHILPLLGE